MWIKPSKITKEGYYWLLNVDFEDKQRSSPNIVRFQRRSSELPTESLPFDIVRMDESEDETVVRAKSIDNYAVVWSIKLEEPDLLEYSSFHPPDSIEW